MNPASSAPWNVVATIVSAFAMVVGGLVLLYLRSIKQDLRSLSLRNDKQDGQIAENRERAESIRGEMAACRIECERSTVSKEDWVRSEGYTRDELRKVAAILNRLEGKLEVVEKLPEICGQIAREVVTQVK